MKLLIIGATGRTGRLLAEQAIVRGHAVTAFVRSPQSLKPRAGLTIAAGNPFAAPELAAVLPGHDVVVSVIGRRSSDDSRVLQDSAAAVLKALQASAASRYIVVSQGLLFPSWHPMAMMLRWLLAVEIKDSAAMESLVRASEANWTIVRPPRLKEGGPLKGYRVSVKDMPGGMRSMERGDLAAFLLDESVKGQYSRTVVGVG
jgi:putative NADH-flavin reductase